MGVIRKQNNYLAKLEKRGQLIVCPYCGAEYMPAEIFIGNSMLGKPQYVERDWQHKIIDCSGKQVDLTEKYNCDYCNKDFSVKAKLSFTSSADTSDEFDSDYQTKIKKETIVLSEQ